MSIQFEKSQKEEIVVKIKKYFDAELDQDIGQFDAEFLLDFFAKEIGPYFYNQGLTDARVLIAKKVEEIDDSLYEIELPTQP